MAQQTLAAEETGQHRSVGSFVKSNIRDYGMLLSLIADHGCSSSS